MHILPPDPMIALHQSNSIVFIINNQVVHKMKSGARFSAIAQSNPVVVDITENADEKIIDVGSLYDPTTGKFS